MSIKVRLTENEAVMAALVGVRRQLRAIYNQRCDVIHGFDNKGGFERHVIGALGELACAKALDRYWNFHVDYVKGAPDIGADIEVRTRTGTDPELNQLMVRPHDPEDRTYVLVRGQCPDYEVVGHIQGKYAKQKKWLEPHGGYDPAHFVPDDELTPFLEDEVG